jgi:hypothetical protein
VFFDVLAWFVVRWPQPWTLPLALAGMALVGAAVVLARRRERDAGDGRGGVGWGALAALAILALSGGLGWALAALLRASGALPYDWSARSWPFRLAFWSLALAVTCGVSWALGPRLRPRGAWAAVWLGWAALAVVAAALAPGVSYPLLVPVLVAGVAGIGTAASRRGAGSAWGTLPPLVAGALLLFPMGWMLYEGMGRPSLPGVSAAVALALTGSLPAVAAAPRRARLLWLVVAAAAVVAGAIAARVLPPFTADAPQPLSLVLHHDADRRETRWVAGSAGLDLPPELAREGRFAVGRPYPWTPDFMAWVSPGPALALAPPELTVEALEQTGEGLRLRGRLRSQRGAPIAGIYAESARLRAARVGGEVVELPALTAETKAGFWSVEDVTLPAEGVPIEVAFRGSQALLFVYDVQPGVEWAGANLLRLRPASAVPIGRGDRSLVSRRYRLDVRGLH